MNYGPVPGERFILVYEKFQKWEWYTKPYMAHLFIHLLLRASWCDTKWQGIDIKRGQVVTGYHALSKQTGISIRSLRTCFKRLESGGEITRKSTSKRQASDNILIQIIQNI